MPDPRVDNVEILKTGRSYSEYNASEHWVNWLTNLVRLTVVNKVTIHVHHDVACSFEYGHWNNRKLWAEVEGNLFVSIVNLVKDRSALRALISFPFDCCPQLGLLISASCDATSHLT